MGFQDRNYSHQPQGIGSGGGFGGGGMTRTLGLPPMSRVIKYLLLINGAVFLMQMIFPTDPRIPIELQNNSLEYWFAAVGRPWPRALQLWRLVSFQFLHGGFWHLFGNMLCLFFFGSALERTWGSRTFLIFYLLCGVLGGFLFILASATGFLEGGYLIGASGGVLGVMAACAILFPQMKVILFPIPLPIPIRVLVLFITVGYVLNVFHRGHNAGGDLCHLGGMAFALVWVFGKPHFLSLKAKASQGAYRRKLEQVEKTQFEVDRILAKVHQQGLQSLTRKEKQILQNATEHQKKY